MNQAFSLCSGLLFANILILALCEGQPQVINKKQKTIAPKLLEGERVVDWHQGTILVVDQDDAVKTYILSTTRELSSEPSLILGHAIYRSGSLDLSKHLPDTEVAVHAVRRTNLQDRSTRHVVVTWGGNKDKGPAAWPAFQYTIYVFLQNQNKVKNVHQERSANSELKDFWVKDLDGDGRLEIIDRGYQMNICKLSIRQLYPDGTVRFLQEIGGRGVRLVADNVVQVEDGAYLDAGTYEEFEEHRWNKETKLFEPVLRTIRQDVTDKMFHWNRQKREWEEIEKKR